MIWFESQPYTITKIGRRTLEICFGTQSKLECCESGDIISRHNINIRLCLWCVGVCLCVCVLYVWVCVTFDPRLNVPDLCAVCQAWHNVHTLWLISSLCGKKRPLMAVCIYVLCPQVKYWPPVPLLSQEYKHKALCTVIDSSLFQDQ